MQVNAASFRFGTIASSVSAAVGESNIQAASATVSSLGAKTRGAVSSTVSFLEEKGVVSGAQGLVASAGATAKSVFAFAQSGVRFNLSCFHHFSQRLHQWEGLWGNASSVSETENLDSRIQDSVVVEASF